MSYWYNFVNFGAKQRKSPLLGPYSAMQAVTDYSYVDNVDSWYKFVNFKPAFQLLARLVNTISIRVLGKCF